MKRAFMSYIYILKLLMVQLYHVSVTTTYLKKDMNAKVDGVELSTVDASGTG